VGSASFFAWSEFEPQAVTREKKTFSSAIHLKHRSVISSSYGSTVSLYMDKIEVQSFLNLREMIFFLNRNTRDKLVSASGKRRPKRNSGFGRRRPVKGPSAW
jgi:hypothetical protein